MEGCIANVARSFVTAEMIAGVYFRGKLGFAKLQVKRRHFGIRSGGFREREQCPESSNRVKL